ncbi:MAG TPA: cytosine permease [Candidatus Acidoferrum sp.]|nr:cytosine permease [Candidatus Acidoferrum sp.]
MERRPGDGQHHDSVGQELRQAEHELLEAAASDNDYTTGIVPMEKRRSKLTLTLLWISLQASVSIMYAGFIARSQGLTLGDVILAGVITSVAIFAYGVGASYLGNSTGQTHTLLTRTVYGRYGSGFVSFLLVVMGMGWYGFQAVFLAQITNGLFGWNVTLVSVIFAAVMIFNNLFGFRGVAAYARYVAAPLLLLWGMWALIKGLATVPTGHWFSASGASPTTTVMVIVALLVGSASWGNEPDIFRYGKPRRFYNWPALAIGYPIGMIVYPVAGYLMAELSKSTAFGDIFNYFVTFSLFGLTGLAVVVFFVNQFALNDGNLYEAVNAVQNIFGQIRNYRRFYTVIVLGLIGIALAYWMNVASTLQTNFFIVAGISGIFVPTATTVMVADVFFVPRLFGMRRPVERVTPWNATANLNYIAIVALVIALVVGSYTGGLIPGLSGFGTTNIGFPTLQSWIIGAGLYLIGVWAVKNSPSKYWLLGYPKTFSEGQASAPKVAAATAGK